LIAGRDSNSIRKGKILRITGRNIIPRPAKKTNSGHYIYSSFKLKTMNDNKNMDAEVLNDLIQINNDRIEGYERASKETKDEDLRAIFADMASQSRELLTELRSLVRIEGETPDKGTTLSGKIYRAWMDVKAKFTGDSRKSVLASCEFGEDAAQRAYETGLKSDDLSMEVRTILTNQKASLRRSHDKIKSMRDAQPA
jgi:uncharacterized protein (TIGR02284 family)